MIQTLISHIDLLEKLLSYYRLQHPVPSWLLTKINKISEQIKSLRNPELELIYLSGPITKGNPKTNFKQACDAQRVLMESGRYAVINPMLTMAHPDEKEITWDCWLRTDLEIVTRVDRVIRLPGLSSGADKECDYARSIGVPVFHACYIPELEKLFPTHHENLTT
jgi:hypothetical protein